MRAADSPQMKPALKQQRTAASSDAVILTGRSSLHRAKQLHNHHHHRHHQQHQRRHSSCHVGSAGDNGLSATQTAAAQPSLIDQLLINSVSAAAEQRPNHNGSHRQQQLHMMSQLQQQNQDDASTAGLGGGGGGSTNLSAERAAGKALAKQWGVSKQFVVATLINCLSHRMRDLQRTDDLQAAAEKLAILTRLRQFLTAVCGLDLVKAIYSEGRAARMAATGLGLRPGTLPADLLRKWSSQENEYHLYWMALLEKAAFSLSQCQDAEALKTQAEFALALVDVKGFPA